MIVPHGQVLLYLLEIKFILSVRN